MKMTKSTLPVGFQPFEVTFTVENEAERNAFLMMTDYDETIPSVVGAHGTSRYRLVQEFLKKLRVVLR